jgi:hypothetical protein
MSGRLTTAVWIAALMAPSAPGHFFDGLPFSQPAEWGALLAFVLLFAANLAAPQRFARAWTAVPVLLAVGKVALAAAVLPLASPACVRVPGFTAADTCEASFDTAPGDRLATRYDRTLQFEPHTWRLGSLNSRRFDAIRQSSVDIPPLPFEIVWRLPMHVVAGAVEGRLCGELVIADGDRRELFRESTATRVTRSIPVAPRSVLTYKSAPCRHAPELAVPLLQQRPAYGIPFALDLGFMGGALVAALIVAGSLIRRHPLLAGSLTIASVTIWATANIPAGDRLLNLVMALPGVLVALGMLSVVHAVALITVPLVCRMSLDGLGFSFLAYTPGFNDPLTYDSFTRDMLSGSFLRGAEDVFYLQPFFRYVRYAEHVLFGESEYAIIVCATLALFAGWLVLIRRLTPATREPFSDYALRAATAGVLLLVCAGLIDAIAFGLSEYVAWAAVPIACAWLFAASETRRFVAAGALVGMCAITRFNLLVPAAVLLAIAAAMRIRSAPRAVAGCAIACAGVLSIPLLHNIWFGNSYTLLPTSALVSETVDIPFARLLTPWQPDVAAYLWTRLQLLLHFGAGHDQGGGFWLPGHGLQALFLVGLVYAIRRRVGWLWLALALVPISALAVHIPYIVHVYYPRHIVFAYLTMGAAVLLWVGRGR